MQGPCSESPVHFSVESKSDLKERQNTKNTRQSTPESTAGSAKGTSLAIHRTMSQLYRTIAYSLLFWPFIEWPTQDGLKHAFASNPARRRAVGSWPPGRRGSIGGRLSRGVAWDETAFCSRRIPPARRIWRAHERSAR